MRRHPRPRYFLPKLLLLLATVVGARVAFETDYPARVGAAPRGQAMAATFAVLFVAWIVWQRLFDDGHGDAHSTAGPLASSPRAPRPLDFVRLDAAEREIGGPGAVPRRVVGPAPIGGAGVLHEPVPELGRPPLTASQLVMRVLGAAAVAALAGYLLLESGVIGAFVIAFGLARGMTP